MATKVLVFESDPAFAGELRNELGKLGCATTVVDDGNVGLQQASSERPDLILLSIELPRMNGFSVCNKLKKDAGLRDVPLIIMSSESSEETFEQHKKLRTRAEDYVHKPIAFGELLRHIHAFIQLGVVGPAAETEAAIVIDDEIEIGSTDYAADDDGTMIAIRASAPPAIATARAVETVDADVDAFADAAFGRLTGPDESGANTAVGPMAAAVHSAPVAEARPHQNPVAEARPHQNGSSEPSTQVRRATNPPAARVPSVRPSGSVRPPGSMRPPSNVDLGEYERVREELVRARARSGEVERELTEVKNDVDKWRMEAAEAERLTREVDELKAKLAAGAPKTGGISSREFLDLREALNKKDKEILALKEQSSRKDKELVESQDRMLALERAKGDLDDKSLAMERELAETKDKTEALAADKDLAKKAGDDFKARAEKARAEVETKDRQLSELRQKHAEELASSEAQNAALRSELDQTLANERASQARALDQAEERRKADLEQAKRDREASLTEAREQADQERQQAVAAQATQLKEEQDGKMASLHRAHQQELDTARTDGEKALREVRTAHEAALLVAREEAEKVGERALEALRAEHGEKTRVLENERDSRIAELESRIARESAEFGERLTRVDTDLAAARGELSSLQEAKATSDAAFESAAAELKKQLEDVTTALKRQLEEVTTARDDLGKKQAAATERLATLEAELASARQDLSETKQKLTGEGARAEKAQAKWEADRQSLERAKDALAVALAQIEEAEGRPLS